MEQYAFFLVPLISWFMYDVTTKAAPKALYGQPAVAGGVLAFINVVYWQGVSVPGWRPL